MGQNWSIPNPLGFLPEHQLPNPYAPVYQDWDLNQDKDPWLPAREVSPGAYGPGFVPPHGGLTGTLSFAQEGNLTTSNPETISYQIPKAKDVSNTQVIQLPAPPRTTSNRKKGRQPTPPTPPVRVTHPHLTMPSWREKYGHLITAGGSSSKLQIPAVTTASVTSSASSTIGDPAIDMGITTSGFLVPLAGLQVGCFLLTKILEIGKSLDWWWTSLSFPGGIPVCIGQNSQSQTSSHSPTSCPPTCTGFRWMWLRRFIIYLLVLLLCAIFLLVLLDWRGFLPVCPMPTSTSTTTRCSTCTATAADPITWPYCCCSKPTDGNCTCWPIPTSWALGKFLWGWASARFSWLNSLLPWLLWFAELSPTVWLLLIWMMWFWGPSLLTIFEPFIPLCALFFVIWELW
nr:MAG: surface protein [Long-fingered bat hepatitis B virus]